MHRDKAHIKCISIFCSSVRNKTCGKVLFCKCWMQRCCCSCRLPAESKRGPDPNPQLCSCWVHTAQERGKVFLVLYREPRSSSQITGISISVYIYQLLCCKEKRSFNPFRKLLQRSWHMSCGVMGEQLLWFILLKLLTALGFHPSWGTTSVWKVTTWSHRINLQPLSEIIRRVCQLGSVFALGCRLEP